MRRGIHLQDGGNAHLSREERKKYQLSLSLAADMHKEETSHLPHYTRKEPPALSPLVVHCAF